MRGGSILLVFAVLAGVAGGLLRLRLDTTVASVSAQDQATRTWTAEQQSFGGDPIAVLLTSKTPKGLITGQQVVSLLQLEGRLANLPDVSVVYGPATTLNEIVLSVKALVGKIVNGLENAEATGGQTLTDFQARYGSLLTNGLRNGLPSLANAKFTDAVYFPKGQPNPAFRWLVPDAGHVAILVRPAPNLDQGRTKRLLSAIRRDVAGAKLAVSSSEVTGQPVIAADLGTEIVNELPLLAALVVAVVGIGFLLTRRRVRWWERLLPLGTGLAATAVTMAIFGWADVPLSLGLLAFMPIILGVGTDYPIYALRGGRPRMILGAALASGAGLALLSTSPLPFVRDLGLALVTGLVLSAIFGVAVARLLRGRLSRDVTTAPAVDDGTSGRSGGEHRRRWLAAAVVGLVIGGIGWASLDTLSLNSDPQSLAAGVPALKQGVQAQSILGASGELDVYVRGGDVLTSTYLSWYRQAEQALAAHHAGELDPIVSPVSLLSWLGSDPSPTEIQAAMALLPSYLTTVSIRDDQAQAVLAYGVKLGSLETESRLIASIRRELPPPPLGASVTITGLPAVAAHSNQLLSDDRVLPNVGGIVAFGVVLALILGRRRDAVAGALSAALATGWGLALLRVTGTGLTPLTVSLGSLTSAVGGEFAVMALGRYATGHRRPWSAVIVAASTSVVGFAVLIVSRLHLLRQFGVVLAGSVVLALLAAWLVVSVTRLQVLPGTRAATADGTGRVETAGIGTGDRGLDDVGDRDGDDDRGDEEDPP